ncbi:MAG: IclR family transcriptional regulator [Paracoccaceae bacterium]|jgi:DNA-binding IclR family transcriptional regulator
MATLQTLDRGLRALSLVADAPHGLSPAEIAAALDVHKAIAYRLIATLEAHGMVARTPQGRIILGTAPLHLGANVQSQFLNAALPHLDAVAQQTGAAACIVLAQGDEAVVALVREAPGDDIMRLTYRLGVRHPLTRGATGIAILAGRPPAPGEPEAVTEARADGFALTRGELQTGAVGVAAPVLTPGMPRLGLEPAVGLAKLHDLDIETAARAVMDCAETLRGLMQPADEAAAAV